MNQFIKNGAGNMKNRSKRFLLKCKGNERLKIDVHVHFLPDSYKKALLENGIVNPDRVPVPKWDVKTHLETMATLGIATSMLSITSPGIISVIIMRQKRWRVMSIKKDPSLFRSILDVLV